MSIFHQRPENPSIFFSGGESDLYEYCLNNPINYTDPTGEILAEIAVYGAYVSLVAVAAGYVNWFYWATHPPKPSDCLDGRPDPREPKPAVLPRSPIPGPAQSRTAPFTTR